MAYTIRLDWIRKSLNSCGSRQCRQMHEAGKTRISNQGPLRRLMRLIRNNSGMATGGSIHSGNDLPRMGRTKAKPQNKPQSLNERHTPFRVNTSPNANVVRIHPLTRCLEKKVKKPNQRLPFEKSATMRAHSAQRRGEQLARTVRSQDTSDHPRPSSTIPLKILEMSQRERSQMGHPLRDRRMLSQEVIDSMRTRNMERMVRESQARMLNERIKDQKQEQSADEPEKSEVPETKVKTESNAVMELLKKAISLGHFHSDGDSRVKDLKISRMQTKLDWNGLRHCRSSMGSFAVNRMSDALQTSHAYHMRIRCAKIQSPRQWQKSETENRNIQDTAANLIKEEQRRLDSLKAAKCHLNVPKVDIKLEKIREHKGVTPTDADKPTNSLIVDPKSFLTRVLHKDGTLSLNQTNNFSLATVENPDVFSNVSSALAKKQTTKLSKGPSELLPN
ncbi:uncharacterized protein LOC108049982 [Drosophila rhopaloa]|uniref:Uncharacterized protein LOC108049982 n=1 Tax=Drosophila rhopaloa TaxID=1041015 RepID=A0A6P4FNW0_DRORH|nr:uncharacterized protein LOC108049982 [Drosophila rhopaloa]